MGESNRTRATISRRRLLAAGAGAGAFASIGILRYPAGAAEFSYKLANDQTPTHPMTIGAIAAAKRVLEASGGRLEINVFPASVLGGDPQMLAQARSGALEFLQIGNNVLGNVVPTAALWSIPFAFSTFQQFMSSAVIYNPRVANNGQRTRADPGPDAPGFLFGYVTNELLKIDLQTIAPFYGGAFQMQNRLGPINSPADLKGVKMRVPPGPIDVATFKAFDATPTVISLGEVYTSLQTHLVDAIEVPLPTVENFKFYELVKFCSMTNHNHLLYIMVANNGAWNRLPRILQDMVIHEFQAAGMTASTALFDAETSLEDKLKSQGVAFNHPTNELFRKAIGDAGLYKTWRDQYGPEVWKLLENATGRLT